jgi:quinol monooxygenase YgiN
MSLIVISEYPCAPGKGKKFLYLLLIEIADTRAYAGCQLLEACVDQDNPDLIVLLEKWAEHSNRESYMAWSAKTSMLDVMELLFLSDVPRFLYLTAAE